MMKKAAVYPAAFLLQSNFTTRCRKVKTPGRQKGVRIGKSGRVTGADKTGKPHSGSKKRNPSVTGESCGKSRGQYKYDKPYRRRTVGHVHRDFYEVGGNQCHLVKRTFDKHSVS